ncbi:MAG: methylmalonyl-CoA epimerase [Gammaproteobacteria bacterium]|jgi:methylmalonyl-CoA epimerase|nr:methylmalonyl-CoA epimerase [Gammaproteobacteria bacterium]MBT5203864.1 methylmalonyl-CoA epimerase [Gammaproteobacteria bacterium]MBT5603663.1 methylmalonyl-CoA epimerase [Gammaproteobacteria bacterium]MBT6245815.1 methylmalonyl-CoA epimerase [Gammaproteobacteria bacterium]
MAMNGVDHVVIRVKDFEEAVQTWRDKLGLDLERTAESEVLGIKQAFFPLANGGFIEIVAPLNDESAVGRAVASRGEGLHTLAMEIDDLDATVQELQNKGVQLIGVGGPQVFIHPKSANGILVQLSPVK